MNEMDDLDRILGELRAVQPAPGLETRVLQRMAAERDRGGRTGVGWSIAAAVSGAGNMRWISVGILAACVCLGGVLMVLRVQGGYGRRQVLPVVATGAAHGAAEVRSLAVTGVLQHVAGRAGAARVRAGLHASVDDTARAGMGFRELAGGLPVHVVAAVQADGGETIDPAYVASFPAPPLPLMRQERLLLRMLHGGGTGELVATLAPGAETAVRSAERAEFSEFFRPVPVTGPRGPETPLPDTGLNGGPALPLGLLKNDK